MRGAIIALKVAARAITSRRVAQLMTQHQSMSSDVVKGGFRGFGRFDAGGRLCAGNDRVLRIDPPAEGVALTEIQDASLSRRIETGPRVLMRPLGRISPAAPSFAGPLAGL
jgi:hypothetical protein